MTISYTAICDVSDIAPYFKADFSANSTPNNANIDTWCLDATALVYAAINDLYVIPVTDDDDLAVLKEICVAYVRDKVNYTMGANVFTVPKTGINVPRTIKFESFKEAIEMLKNGTIMLVNTPNSSIVHTVDYNSANSIVSESEKGVDQW